MKTLLILLLAGGAWAQSRPTTYQHYIGPESLTIGGITYPIYPAPMPVQPVPILGGPNWIYPFTKCPNCEYGAITIADLEEFMADTSVMDSSLAACRYMLDGSPGPVKGENIYRKNRYPKTFNGFLQWLKRNK